MMWNSTVEPDRPQVTIRRMRIACWIIKAKNTHSEYVIFIAFLLKEWLHLAVLLFHLCNIFF